MALGLGMIKILQVHKVECCLKNGISRRKKKREDLNIPKTEA